MSGAVAGAVHGINLKFDLPSKATGSMEHARSAAIHAGVKTVAETTILGTPVEQALKANLKTGVIHAAAGYTAEQIGQAWGLQNRDDSWSEYCLHKVAHGLLGGTAGVVIADNRSGFAPGAIGAIVAEMVAEQLTSYAYDAAKDQHQSDPSQGLDPNIRAQRQQALQTEIERNRSWGVLSASVMALIADQDVNIAKMTAQNAVDNNFLFATESTKH